MADQERMHPSAGSLEAQFSEIKVGNAGLHEKLKDYLIRMERYIEAAPMDSCKFHKMQCEHLVFKREVLVQSARSVLNVDLVHGPCSSVMAETFKLMLTLAIQIKDFVQSCCVKSEIWIQTAMTMTNTSEYVSSLGFNVELCKLICEGFLGERQGPGSSTTVELQGRISKTEAEIVGEMRKVRKGFTWADLDNMYRTEAEIVKVRAEVDLRTLSRDVTSELSSLKDDKQLQATYLLQILSTVQGRSTQDDSWSILGFLYKWVIPVDKPLGRGATASVYETTWLGMPVAKKVFEGLNNPYFQAEVKNLAPLRHSNISSMFCCKKTDYDSCIIMELMDEDLGTLLHNKRNRDTENSGSSPFPILEAVDIMLQMGEGVNYLHNNKMVHRDLKPQNILVKRMDAEKLDFGYIHVKVTDFGLSHTKDCSARMTNLEPNVGTNRYMAPEVIKSTEIKSPSKSDNLLSFPFKCDTYSYGMVCYEILTGYVPFHEERDEKRLKENVKKGDRPKLCGDLPPMLKALIEKCWSRDPKDRPRFDLVCSQLRYLKYLLITGADEETHESAATEFEAAARVARKKDEAREQEAVAKLREEAALANAKLANDSLTQEERDAQAKEHELELKAAAANKAREHRASLKGRAKAALVAHRQSLPPFKEPTLNQRLAADERIQYEKGKCHIAVCGVSGSGKSSLINAFRGLNPRDEGAARVGVTETTLEVTRYPDPRNEYPYSDFVWYDIPGAGTAAVSDAQYFEKQGLLAFDKIILVYSDRFTNVDIDIIENCIRVGIRILIVRSKADQHIENMINDEADCSSDDNDDEDQIYEDMKAKYIDATKSDFNMHKEIILAEVFGNSWELQRLLSDMRVWRVYNVCARNVGSLMQAQARVAKGRGLHNNNKIAAKMFDEALLIEEILRQPDFLIKVSGNTSSKFPEVFKLFWAKK
ncbi:hypothetical protein KC19_11G008900 [Ceratodon purpureus]|uniref:Uncharacterized protein n=1 Tax=Ceratodon purpureus TaxID=3225 RepID=A0A8T0GFA8_CERPU|nr:hypothetical protein KC19_11G008900 [Ceratodon purpureus]